MNAVSPDPWSCGENGPSGCIVCTLAGQAAVAELSREDMVAHMLVTGGVLAAIGPGAFRTATTTCCEKHQPLMVRSIHILAEVNKVSAGRMLEVLGVAPAHACVRDTIPAPPPGAN